MRVKKHRVLIYPLILSIIALVELYSYSPYFALRQFIFLSFGFIAYFSLSRLSLRQYLENFYKPIYLFGLLILVITLIFGGGGDVKRWLNLGFINIQTSEFAALILIIFIASIFSKSRETKDILLALILTSVYIFLVILQPNLGNALTFYIIFVIVSLGVCRPRWLLLLVVLLPFCLIFSFSKSFFMIFLIFTLLVLALVKFETEKKLLIVASVILFSLLTPYVTNKVLKEYQKQRIIAFLEPDKYEKTLSWQSIQAQIALGSGGLWGKGFKKGTQKELKFLPESHTDFIFASIGEEFGFISTLTIITLSILFLLELLNITYWRENLFERAFGLGVFGYFFYHFAINMAISVGLFPVVGIPLPFMSYGGSHLLNEFILLGILQSFSRE